MPSKNQKIYKFNESEAKWLALNAHKLGQLAEQKSFMLDEETLQTQREVAKHFSKHWDDDANVVNVKLNDDGVAPVPLTPNEVTFLKTLVDKSFDTLKDRIIPGYERRMNGPSKTKKYKPYLDKAKKTLKMLGGLSEKLDKEQGE